MVRRCILLCALSVLAPYARADVLHLADGSTVEGVVVREGATYRVKTGDGTASVFRTEEVAEWEKKPTLAEEYRLRADNAPPDGFEEQMALSDWCRERLLSDAARYHAALAVALRPEDEAARRAAGFVKADGAWISWEESRKQQGYLEHNGRWMPAEEALKLRMAEERKERMRKAEAETWRLFRLASKEEEDAPFEPMAARLQPLLPDAPEALRRASDDGSRRVRRLAFLLLGRMKDRPSLDLLCRRLGNENDAAVAQWIAWQFSVRADRMDVMTKVLDLIVNQENTGIRRRAWLAARAIGDRRVIDALVPMVDYNPAPREEQADKDAPKGWGEAAARKAAAEDAQVGKGKPKKSCFPAHEALVALTGQSFPPEKERWANWWRQSREKFALTPPPGLPPPPAPAAEVAAVPAAPSAP